VTNAADNVDGYRRSAKILRSLNGERPLRITETPYIRYKHNEIPPRVIRNNKDVRSLSNCAACHTRADTGSYAEREIDIPGIGRWEDD
ncbi:MAG: diheme cytochrome c, partial [Gammaproteobacteria bacterium]|nr:diheme cytochrome c [Gammaproteobacteria bacterium]MCW8927420.1 diheme cytochrome c [Gammaproteobacteria bacterium]